MGRVAEPARDKILRRIVVTPGGCWEWQGAKGRHGYGRVAMPTGKMGGRTEFTHRVAYEAFIGPIPDGLVIDHLCRNRGCCNPDHLEAVTQRVNLLRGDTLQSKNILKTHCKYGHEFTEQNTRRTPRGRRCRECERRRARESATRKAGRDAEA